MTAGMASGLRKPFQGGSQADLSIDAYQFIYEISPAQAFDTIPLILPLGVRFYDIRLPGLPVQRIA